MSSELEKRLSNFLPELLPFIFLAMFIVPVVISLAVVDKERSACDGNKGSPAIKIVNGSVEYIYKLYRVNDDKRAYVILDCNKRYGCTNDLYVNAVQQAVGKKVQAGVCNDHLLWVDVQQQRIYSRSTGYASAINTGVVFTVSLIALSLIFLKSNIRAK